MITGGTVGDPANPGVRDEMGLTDTVLMIPFCRTVGDADHVLETMADCGRLR